jgi:hypothetical protein
MLRPTRVAVRISSVTRQTFIGEKTVYGTTCVDNRNMFYVKDSFPYGN